MWIPVLPQRQMSMTSPCSEGQQNEENSGNIFKVMQPVSDGARFGLIPMLLANNLLISYLRVSKKLCSLIYAHKE